MTDVSISIDVPDLDQAEKFYREALDCVPYDKPKGMCILQAGITKIYLLAKKEGTIPFAGSEQARSYSRHWTPIHLDFASDDIDASAELIRTHGGTIEGVDSGSWGSIAYCSDPFGNGFCLINEQTDA